MNKLFPNNGVCSNANTSDYGGDELEQKANKHLVFSVLLIWTLGHTVTAVMFAPTFGQIGPKWDEYATFKDLFQYILIY